MSQFAHTQVCGPDTAVKQICVKCALEIEVTIGQPGSKQWRFPVCSKCNSNRAKFSMMFGTWPPKVFKQLSPEVQRKIWRDLQDCKTRQDMENVLIRNIVESKVNDEGKKFAGKFLPLSMYKAMGLTKNQVDGHACKHDIYFSKR